MENKTLTQQQVKNILTNAPANLDKKMILQKLVEKGYNLEGFDNSQQKVSQPSGGFGSETIGDIKQIGTGIAEDFKKRQAQADETKAAYKSGEQGLASTAFQAIGQGAGLVGDVIDQGLKGAVKAVLPQGAENAVKSGVSAVSTPIVNSSPVQSVIEKYNKLKETHPELAKNIDAALGIGDLALNFVGLEGAGAAGKLAKEGIDQGLKTGAEVGGKIANKIASSTDEAFASAKAATQGIRNAAGEIVPTADRIVNDQVTKALQLTSSDVKNIESSTGNVVGQFMAEHNLIGSNLKETENLVNDFFDTNYKAVREEVGKVTTKYKPTEIPRYKQSLTELKGQIDGVAGQETKLAEIDTLLKKKTASLADAQRAKELIDDLNSLYKAGGDAKEGVIKQGLVTMRKDLQTFIEKEVKKNTGADIAALNNKVSTSKGILKAAEARATSGITSSNIKMGDLGVFGTGSFIGGPLVGGALVIGKKIMESPAIRFRVAKFFDALSDARKLKLTKEFADGVVPKELEQVVQDSGKTKTNIKTKTIPNKIPNISKVSNKKVK